MLVKKYNHAKRKNRAIIKALNGSSINLNHKLRDLKAKYINLTTLIFSSSQSNKEIKDHRKAILRYLGADFYHQAVIMHDSNLSPSDNLLDKNKGTIVTFSNYYVKNHSIDLVIYTTFTLKKRIQGKKAGLAYLIINYNLKTNKVNHTQIQLANK